MSGIFVYPVKSMRGTSLDRAVVERRGLRFDRRWLVVDEAGEFLSQRSHPLMARFDVAVSEDRLCISLDGHGSLDIDTRYDGPIMPVNVWDNGCEAVRHTPEVDAWLSGAIGQKCHLVRMGASRPREIKAPYSEPGDEVSFADAFPLLVISEGSLEDLNSRMAHPLPMNRFRPNIVISGVAPYEEDRWRTLRIGETLCRAAKRSARCAVTTTDQLTGERGKEPLTTLASYRQEDGKVYFGQNLIPVTLGEIRVGTKIEC